MMREGEYCKLFGECFKLEGESRAKVFRKGNEFIYFFLRFCKLETKCYWRMMKTKFFFSFFLSFFEGESRGKVVFPSVL